MASNWESRRAPVSGRAWVRSCALLLIVTSVFTMSACATSGEHGKSTADATPSSDARGETLSAARERLTASVGLSDTSIEVSKTLSGLNTHHQLRIEATTRKADPAEISAIVDHVVTLAWSVKDVRTDKGVSVRLHTSAQVTVGDAVKNERGRLIYRSEPASFRTAVLFPRSTIEDRLGDWPGAVPDDQG